MECRNGVPTPDAWLTNTAAGWTAANTILPSGMPGYETDTQRFKIGDGSTAWTSLKYRLDYSIIGAKWNQASTDPALTRIDLAGNTTTLSSIFFDAQPPWSGMRRCNLSDAGKVNAYWGDAAFSYTGSNGQVMVEIPKFYYKTSKVGSVYSWWISPYNFPGFTVHPAFVKDSVELQKIYIGAFEGSVYDVTTPAAAEVNSFTITSVPAVAGNISLLINGNFPVTLPVTLADDTIKKVIDTCVAVGAQTDYQGVVWTPTNVTDTILRYTAGSTGLKTTMARVIPTIGAIGSGTATGADATTLTCTGKTWTVNGWAGYVIRILTGTGAASYGIIASNTADVITVADWLVGADPGVGSTFEITATGVTGTIAKSTSGAGGYVLNDASGVSFTATTGDKLCSVAGVKPLSGWNNGTATLPNMRVLAQNRGTGWNLMNFNQVSAIQLLYLLSHATFNSQTALGAGVTAITDATAGDAFNNAINTGFTAGVGTAGTDYGNLTGECALVTHYKTAEAAKANSYRGIENFYGNLYKWVDGINIKDPYMPWIADHDFASDLFSPPYVDTTMTNHNADGYPTNFGYAAGLNYGFLPSAVGGSSSTYLCDYYYRATGNRSALLGGSWLSGGYAGAFCWNVAYATSHVSRVVGCRLAFFV